MKRVLLLLALLLAGFEALSAGDIEFIELQNRPAAELIPVIEPMLDRDASLSGQGFTLIIRTSPQNLEQIRSLVRQLDSAAKQLLISVFQGTDRQLRALELDAGIRYNAPDIDVRAGQPDHRTGGADIRYSTGDTQLNAGTLSTRARLSDNPIHHLRISEGTAGYIETGKSIPFFAGNLYRTPAGTAIEGGVEYKDVTTGFYVFPRVHGEQVMLEISPHKDSLSHSQGGAINTQRVTTTVTGRLGQWLQIGAVNEQVTRSGSSLGAHTSTQSRNNASIWIRADVSE